MNMNKNTILQNSLIWLGALLIPLGIALTILRILLTPVFVQVEYRLPKFPADTFGFTVDDRLQYGQLALDYLINDADVSFLGDLTFKDGSPLYNERELVHMEDVKVLVQFGLQVWYGILGILMMIGGWSYRANRFYIFRQVAGRGGQITVLLLLTMLTYLVINFNQLFIQFHGLFFDDETWLFYYSDTLIRLFPERFWRDAFAVWGGVTLLVGAVLWYFMSWRYRKSST